MNLAIIGSRQYENTEKIQKVIEKYQNRYKENLVIVSGGCKTGADFIAKTIALDMNIKYVEFAPSHFSWNDYCFNSIDYYNKPYNVKNYWIRNKEIVEFSDNVLGFICKNIESKGTLGTIEIAKEIGKKHFVFKD